MAADLAMGVAQILNLRAAYAREDVTAAVPASAAGPFATLAKMMSSPFSAESAEPRPRRFVDPAIGRSRRGWAGEDGLGRSCLCRAVRPFSLSCSTSEERGGRACLRRRCAGAAGERMGGRSEVRLFEEISQSPANPACRQPSADRFCPAPAATVTGSPSLASLDRPSSRAGIEIAERLDKAEPVSASIASASAGSTRP